MIEAVALQDSAGALLVPDSARSTFSLVPDSLAYDGKVTLINFSSCTICGALKRLHCNK